jgi:hypothetical protein
MSIGQSHACLQGRPIDMGFASGQVPAIFPTSGLQTIRTIAFGRSKSLISWFVIQSKLECGATQLSITVTLRTFLQRPYLSSAAVNPL